ncbi:MAG: TonB-dependent receptor [Bacteroidota bacterium]|nr:TonB-dependent receptor [Bacteroidota bacterium]
MKIKKYYLRASYIILLMIFSFIAFSQESANIYGRITDKSNADPLIGANVFIKGTSKGAATDINGKYRITGVKAGVYSIDITYIGYKRTVLTGIKLTKGEEKKLDVALPPTSLTIDEEVVIIGKKPLVDLEQSRTESRISSEKIEAAPVRDISGLLNSQAGVINSSSGLRIRGGRTYETGFYIDGVSAKDPLAGTGMGLAIGSNSIKELDVSTGGIDVEYGNSTSGTVNTKTKTGGKKTLASVSYKRDNFAFNKDYQSCFNQQVFEFNLGGPGKKLENFLPGAEPRFRYYTSLRFNLSDEFTKNPADQINSSIVNSSFWTPYQDNRWSGFLKFNYDLDPKKRITFSYLKSMNINQDVNMLRVTGNDVSYLPGYQFSFHLDPDNASTFTHESNLQTLRWNHTPGNRFSYQATISRLFVHLRGDANGRQWRPDVVNTEFQPLSIREFPSEYFNPEDDVVFTLSSPGLYNNNGIATLWHDHIVEEYTLKISGYLYSKDSKNKLTFGAEAKHQFLQWIDIKKPWIGAPIQLADGTYSQSFRLGEISDIWKVKPITGALYFSDKYKFLGLVALVGGRFQYWSPGKFVDEAVDNSDAPIRDEIREAYKENTTKIGNRRYKLRFLPKVSASFPVKENQVLYFNYGHSTVLPHPSYLYTGLDPQFTDRSTLSFIGNPNLDPEVDISYEIGLRSQITSDDALNFSAFWKDKYDFITSASIQVKDVTGREVTRTMRINSDYARIRGLELSYIKRVKKWFRGQLSFGYMTATGQSSSASETLKEIINSGNREDTKEYPLPWDRPLDIKFNTLFIVNNASGLFNQSWLNHLKFYVEGIYRSGKRYTPYILTGYETYSGRPIFEYNSDPNARYSETGKNWFWLDMNVEKWWSLKHVNIAWTLEITNILNNKNAAIVNPVTGMGYEYGDNVPTEWRNPVYNDPRDPRSDNIPPDNPARYLAQRHIMTGISIKFK